MPSRPPHRSSPSSSGFSPATVVFAAADTQVPRLLPLPCYCVLACSSQPPARSRLLLCCRVAGLCARQWQTDPWALIDEAQRLWRLRKRVVNDTDSGAHTRLVGALCEAPVVPSAACCSLPLLPTATATATGRSPPSLTSFDVSRGGGRSVARAVRGGLVGGCFTAGRSKRPSLPARGPSGEKRPIEVQVHRGQKSGIFYFVFIFKISSFRCSPRPYAHLCAGARAAVGPRAKRCKRRGGRPGGAASTGGGFGPIHVTAGLNAICSRSWFVMNICMSHNVGMAVIYMKPIIRKYSIFCPKSEPE